MERHPNSSIVVGTSLCTRQRRLGDNLFSIQQTQRSQRSPSLSLSPSPITLCFIHLSLYSLALFPMFSQISVHIFFSLSCPFATSSYSLKLKLSISKHTPSNNDHTLYRSFVTRVWKCLNPDSGVQAYHQTWTHSLLTLLISFR